MAINDSIMVIPQFPLLILLYFVLKDGMTWTALIVIMAALGWSYDARLIRSVAISLKSPAIHDPERLFRHEHVQDPRPGAPALCVADRLRDDDEQHDLVDRHGDYAVGAWFHRISKRRRWA